MSYYRNPVIGDCQVDSTYPFDRLDRFFVPVRCEIARNLDKKVSTAVSLQSKTLCCLFSAIALYFIQTRAILTSHFFTKHHVINFLVQPYRLRFELGMSMFLKYMLLESGKSPSIMSTVVSLS